MWLSILTQTEAPEGDYGISLTLSNLTVIATALTTVVTALIPLGAKWAAAREAERSRAVAAAREAATREAEDLARENAALRLRVAALEAPGAAEQARSAASAPTQS